MVEDEELRRNSSPRDADRETTSDDNIATFMVEKVRSHCCRRYYFCDCLAVGRIPYLGDDLDD